MTELYIDGLSGNEFEEYLVSLFKGLGYNVEHTPVSNDYGADLVISKGEEKTVIQAKRYSSTVGISSVQEVIGSKNYYQATKCLVVTNNYFTPNAIELAKVNDVELWDRDILMKMAILSVNPNFDTNPHRHTEEYQNDNLYEVGDTDVLLPDAIYLVVSEQMASISMLQRRMRIEYTRAAKIIDEMEFKGVISGYNGNKPRKVLLSPEDLISREIFNSNIDVSLNNAIKPNGSILNKILGITISLFLSFILVFICVLNIKNALIGIISIFIVIFLSFKIGFLLSDKIFKVNI